MPILAFLCLFKIIAFNLYYTPDNSFLINSKVNVNIHGKPQFIIHVGPPKTGTTSIQCGLAHMSEVLATLDNYYYIGTQCHKRDKEHNIEKKTGYKPLNPIYDMFIHLEMAHPLPFSVQESLDHHYRQNHNIILSVEKFSAMRDTQGALENMRKVFDPEKWDVRIIIAYRRYFEWFPSQYNQEVLGGRKRGEDHIPSFREYFLKKHNHWETGAPIERELQFSEKHIRFHPTISTLQTYASLFDVEIFNYYMQGDLVTNFVCHAIPGAHQTCDLLRQVSPNYHERKQVMNEGFVIAREAHDRNLFIEENEVQLDQVWVSIIQKKYESVIQKNGTIPQSCLSEQELEYLYKISIESEHYLSRESSGRSPLLWVNNIYSNISHYTDSNALHKRGSFEIDFQTYKKSGRFCFMDLNKIFELSEWLDVFKIVRNYDLEFLKEIFHDK